jgi:tetratricopeptide (TPR) repeat protein
MSDSENKMNILNEEANANYNASRYKDAARTFEHLITLAIQNGEEEEAIYFAYRAADCWRKDKNEMNRALVFRDIGNLAHSFCSKIIDGYVKKTKKPEEKAKALMLAGECLLTQNKTKAIKNLTEAEEIFENLADSSKDPRVKANYLMDALKCIDKLGHKKQAKTLKIRIANHHVSSAEKDFKKNTPEDLQSALRSYEDALEMFQKLKMKEDIQSISKKIKTLKEKVAEYDPFAT